MLTGQILLQLVIILVVAQFCSFVCRKLGQPQVIGEILAGLLLGPSLLGLLWPGFSKWIFPLSTLPTLQTLGDIGLIFYMFTLGSRLDIQLLRKQSSQVMGNSLASILLPLVLGGVLAFMLFPDLAGSKATFVSFILVLGTSLAITAFPVLARILVERRMLNTEIGTLALAGAMVNDVVAWCLLAIVVATIHAAGLLSILTLLGVLALYTLVMFFVVRPLLLWIDQRWHKPQAMFVLIITLLLLSAYVTNLLGIHPVFGAFIMGMIVPRRANLAEYLRGIDRFNQYLFLPLYFVFSGLRTQIGLIDAPGLWLICLLILLIACVSKIAGGMLGTRLTGVSWRDSLGVGVLMNTRGLVELIVLNIALDLGVLSPALFAMLVIMALLTTMFTSPALSLLGYRNRTAAQDEGGADLAAVRNELLEEDLHP